jgi:putative transposase
MRDVVLLCVHVIVTIFRFARPAGVRSVLAESALLKHQLLILNRSRRRAPNLHVWDRFIAGLCSLLLKPRRLARAGILVKPSTLLSFHRILVRRKYRLLFAPKRRAKVGPKGPDSNIIQLIVEMKQRNPTWGCPRIAEQVNMAFGTSINKDVVRRILDRHYRPPSDGGPSWLTFLAQMKDSLWSLDLFRCESAALRTYWVLVVMDQYTRRIIGFGIQAGIVDGLALCRMFSQAIRGATVPKYLTSDHDPLYRFHRWQANLRVLDVREIKTVPYVPWSHPFIERLIGTIRRECLDRFLFWTATDLEAKLSDFRNYYNRHRVHASLAGNTPIKTPDSKGVNFNFYSWRKHCRGLYQTPKAP